MSIRYGVELIPEPDFVSKVYRARQVICSQYASWAAEMFMVHIPVAGFFRSDDVTVAQVALALERVPEKSRHQRRALSCGGVNVFNGETSTIFLDFKLDNNKMTKYIVRLHNDVMDVLESIPTVEPDRETTRGNYWPHLPLMQQATLPTALLEEAVQFADGVVRHRRILGAGTDPWKLWLVKYESDAADDDWSDGSWARALRWMIVESVNL